MRRVDIVIPTCQSLGALTVLCYELRKTVPTDSRLILTCLQESASVNRNFGLDRAKTELVIMLDDDICGFPRGWVEGLVRLMEENPRCVMGAPRLLRPDGHPGLMLGHPPGLEDGSRWIVPARELPTACIIIRRNDLRFDQNFIGSGWEDTDYCAQLRERHPDGQFIVDGAIRLVHRNEMKNQAGPIFEKNKAYYEQKWRDR